MITRRSHRMKWIALMAAPAMLLEGCADPYSHKVVHVVRRGVAALLEEAMTHLERSR